MAASFFTYEIHQGEEFVGVPPNSHAAGLFGADARALAPGVTQLGVPYHLMEAFALCFVQCAGGDGGAVPLLTSRLSIAKMENVYEYVAIHADLEGGSAATALHSALYADLEGPPLPLPLDPGHALHVDASDWEAARDPIGPAPVGGSLGTLDRGLKWHSLLMPVAERGIAASLAYRLGPRGTANSRQGVRMFGAHVQDLLREAVRAQLPSVSLDDLPEFIDSVSDTEIGDLVENYLKSLTLPRYLSIPYPSTILGVKTELAALTVWRSQDADKIKSLLPRLNLMLFPALDKVFGYDGIGPLPGNRQVAHGFLTVMGQLIKISPHANLLDDVMMNRFETVMTSLIPAIDDPPHDCQHQRWRIDTILEYATHRKEDRDLGSKAAITSAKPAAITYGDIFGPKARRALEQQMADPEFRDLSALLKERAEVMDSQGYFDELFKGASRGVLLPLQALACNLRGLPNNEVFTLMRDMQPHLARYFGGILALDAEGKTRKSHQGYEMPEAGLNLLLRGDLFGLITFAYKKGIPHCKSRSLVGYPVPERKDWPDTLTGDILDEISDYVTPLLHGYGFRVKETTPLSAEETYAMLPGVALRRRIDASTKGTLGEIFGFAKQILRDVPEHLKQFASAKAMDFMRIGCREATIVWQTTLKSSGARKFNSVLYDDHPDGDVFRSEFRASIEIAHSASSWMFMQDKTPSKSAPKSGKDDDNVKRDKTGGGARDPRDDLPQKRPKTGAGAGNTVTTFSLPAGREQFGHVADGPGWMERYLFEYTSGKESILRFDLRAIANKLGVGLDERHWPYVLCQRNSQRFYDKGKSKTAHSTLSPELLRAFSGPPYATRRPM